MLERMRRQFRIPEKILTERRFKAKQFCEAARVAQHQGRWNEAASCIRLCAERVFSMVSSCSGRRVSRLHRP